MSLPMFIRSEAEADMALTRDWYVAQRVDLGQEFLDQLFTALDRIAELPVMYAAVHEDVRACRLRRFPHVIYNRVLPDQIEIIAVLHGSRDPSTWRDRN